MGFLYTLYISIIVTQEFTVYVHNVRDFDWFGQCLHLDIVIQAGLLSGTMTFWSVVRLQPFARLSLLPQPP